MKLTTEQQTIVDTSGNILVIANAGTGKTHTLVEKLRKEMAANKNHKTTAAITFTRKATRELRNRLCDEPNDCYVATTNSFIMSEIMPFLYDVTRKEVTKKNRIDYKLKYSSLKEVCEELINSGRIGVVKFKKGEKPRNSLFAIALAILNKSKACRQFLISKYFKIFVDEYQDCDTDMHDFFLELAQGLKIPLVLFGDNKQFIYGWRGANKESFKQIKKISSFTTLYLTKNFRSNQAIQNYSNLLYPLETSNLYIPAQCDNIVSIYSTNPRASISKISANIDRTLKTAILRWSNDNAEESAKEYSAHVSDCVFLKRPPISDVNHETLWLHYELAKYFIFPEKSVYDIIYECPVYIDDTNLLPQLKAALPPLAQLPSKIEDFKYIYDNVLSLFGYDVYNEDFEALYKTISDKRFHPFFRQHEYRNIAATIHTAKGLEFEQVILFAEDFDLQNDESLALHYVAVTRAMKKLIIINEKNNPRFTEDLRQLFASVGRNLSEIVELRCL